MATDQTYFPSLKSLLIMAIQNYLFLQSPPFVPYDQEAFPDAYELFCKAFGLSDPTPELLDLIKAHPTEAAVRDLLIEYTDAAEENPSRAYALASVLVALRDSPEAPVIEGSSLAVAFHVRLADIHSQNLTFDDDNDTCSPTNTYLTNCLLSGLSLKHGLTSCPNQYLEIDVGLNVDRKSSNSELWVIGACIQLLTIGSKIILEKMFKYSANEVATLLRLQQFAGTVKNSNAPKLLEVCSVISAP